MTVPPDKFPSKPAPRPPDEGMDFGSIHPPARSTYGNDRVVTKLEQSEPREPTRVEDGSRPPAPTLSFSLDLPEPPAYPTLADANPYGVTVHGYSVLEEIGRGGMGVVYKAVQTGLKRTVALKMVTGVRTPSRSELIRFLAEAETVAAVSHPNVVQVYEYGESGGRPFLALEYLPGGNLAEWLRTNPPITPEEAAGLLVQVARGVAAAHALGIVHRDLKPQNVLRGADGELKVTDFGLAKRGTGSELTKSNAVLGTPAYMAPEQARGQTKFVGPQADVWGLGVILYELLTGGRPFDAMDVWGLLAQVTNSDPVPPRKLAPGVPKDLELICLHCLTREPTGRYPTAAELADDLDRFLLGESIGIRAPGRAERVARWVRRKPAAAAAWALAVVTFGLGTFGGSTAALWLRAEAAKQTADAARQAAEGATRDRQKAFDELQAVRYGNTVGLAHREYQANEIQKARALLAENKPAGGGWEWDYLNRVCNGDAVRIDPAAGRAYSVAFAADGTKLVTAHADGTARVWDAATGKPGRVLRPGPAGEKPAEVLDAAASADGKRVVTAGADGAVRVWDADAGTEVATFRLGGPEGSAGKSDARSIAYRPDGKAFAAGGADGVLKVWDAANFKEASAVPAGVGPINSVRYSPDGRWLAAGGTGGVKVWDRDGTGAAPAYAVPPLKDTVAAVAVTSDARLAVGDTAGAVRVWNLPESAGKLVVAYRAHVGKVAALAFTADGTRLASAGSDRVVRVWDGRTGDRTLTLKGHTDAAWGVAFDPAGKRLASAGLDGTARVWDLTRPPEGWLVPSQTARVNALAVSADGASLAVGGSDRIKVFAVADGGPKPVGPPDPRTRSLPVEPGDENPDERPAVRKTLLFDPAAETPEGELAVRFLAGGKSLLSLTSGGELQRWESDATVGWRAAGDAVRLPDGAVVTAAAVSPDGDRAAVGRKTGEVAVWDVRAGRPLVAWPAHRTQVRAVAFGPGGAVTTGDRDGGVKLWDADGRREVPTAGHTGDVLAASFSPDGSLVATASADHTARVWDAKTGALVWALRGHLHWVRAVAFSPDGRRIVTGGQDGVVKVWDAATGYELLSLTVQTDGVTGVVFSPDGKTLYAGGYDGRIRLYNAAPVSPAVTTDVAGK